MTIQWNDNGKTQVGPLKTFTFTYPTPYEKNYSSPLTISNVSSIPATPIDTYTIQTSDIPVISPSYYSTKWSAFVVVGGKNTDTTNKTINFQINKNGTSAVSGSINTTTAQFYTVTTYNLVGINAGDKLDLYMWCSTSSLTNYDYIGIFIIPTQTLLTKAGIYQNLTMNFTKPALTATGASTAYWFYGGWNVFPCGSSTNFSVPLPVIFPNISFSSFGIGKPQYGDLNTGSQSVNDPTYRPKYISPNVPSSVSYREVLR